MLQYPRDSLDAHENIIFEFATDFVEHFWNNGWELLQVSFSTYYVKVTLLADCGQHICDSVSVKDYQEWLETFSWYKED